MQAQIAVAIARADVGLEIAHLGRPAAGLADLDEAIRTGERLLAANPAELFYADLLIVGYGYQADILSSVGDQPRAARKYSAALEMAERVSRADPRDLESPLSIAKLHAALAVVYGREAEYARGLRETDAARSPLAAVREARPADAEAAYVFGLNHANASVLQECVHGGVCEPARLRLPCLVN